MKVHALAFECKTHESSLVSPETFFQTLAQRQEIRTEDGLIYATSFDHLIPEDNVGGQVNLRLVAGVVIFDTKTGVGQTKKERDGKVQLSPIELPDGQTFCSHNYFLMVPSRRVGLYLTYRSGMSRMSFERLIRKLHLEDAGVVISKKRQEPDWGNLSRSDQKKLEIASRRRLKLEPILTERKLLEFFDELTDIRECVMDVNSSEVNIPELSGVSAVSSRTRITISLARDKNLLTHAREFAKSLVSKLSASGGSRNLELRASHGGEPVRVWELLNKMGTVSSTAYDTWMTLKLAEGEPPGTAVRNSKAIDHLLGLFAKEYVNDALKLRPPR